MSKKIPQQYDELIYGGYKELLAQMVPITKIAGMLNEKWGTDFAESSMRNRYEQMEHYGGYFVEDDDKYQERLFHIAKQDLELKKQRKVLVKERSLIDGVVKEVAERDLIKEVIKEALEVEVEHNVRLKVGHHTEHAETHVYAYGDVHYGYESDLEANFYNPEVAKERLIKIFEHIVADVVANGYDKIVIVDMGDQIEGAALRVSQLIRIAMTMTEQARDYADITIELLEQLAGYLPEVEITFLMISEDNHAQLRLFNTKRDELPENLALLITNQVKTYIDTAHKYGGMKNLTFHSADEILVDFDGYPVVFAHGHQYGRKEDILHMVEQRHQQPVMLYVAAHWHRFSVKYKDVTSLGQQAMMFLPSVVGDTDFSQRLHVSSYPGFLKITLDSDDKVANAKLIKIS